MCSAILGDIPSNIFGGAWLKSSFDGRLSIHYYVLHMGRKTFDWHSMATAWCFSDFVLRFLGGGLAAILELRDGCLLDTIMVRGRFYPARQ